MRPTRRAPTPPGEVLLEEFLKPMGLTQTALAERMGVPVQSVNLLIRDRREVTARTAVLLAEALGTSPEFWLQLQMQVSLWKALQEQRGQKKRAPLVPAHAR